ncbi:hypothetical protein WMY93_009815 [Mugilogobius chulae]|uniref:TIR domain-containing protein n=1 Tax=Mugilogobius chulae TaxID=88201 RepID=A0AAW0P8Y2_9GOBI
MFELLVFLSFLLSAAERASSCSRSDDGPKDLCSSLSSAFSSPASSFTALLYTQLQSGLGQSKRSKLSSLVLLTLVSSFTYHFLRWQLVYGYYLFRAFLYDGKKKKEGCADVYDAFVSYNVHDEEWVYHELVPELEDDRDGSYVCTTATLNQVRQSNPGEHHRRHLQQQEDSVCDQPTVSAERVVLMEIQMASFRLFDEQKDVLILLFLEEISSDQLSPFYRMRKLVKRRTYLSWTQARSHRGLFWERVRQALESGNNSIDINDPLTANA